MIRLFTSNNKIKLQINLDASRLSELTFSSKLLRLAEILNQAKLIIDAVQNTPIRKNF